MNINEAISILNIDEDFTVEDLDAAYKKLARDFHPDKGENSDEMARINRARDVLQKHVSVNNPPAVIKQFDLNREGNDCSCS